MASFSDLIDRLDADENKRGTQFEHICKWFLTHDPRYRRQLKKVWLWDEWPGRWGADAGIDLVAKHQDGSLWAIQAKAYNPDYSVTRKDVDSFLTESARKVFSYRLLIATTNRIGKTALRTLEDQEKPAGLMLRGDLDKADLVWPKRPSDLRAPRPKLKKPFPHNRQAVRAVIKGFEDNDRGQLIMACGTGKTLVGLWVAEKLESQRTLVLFPSLSLLSQTLREWTANAKVPFAFLPVCSDETVSEKDSLVANTSELGMPVTTNPDDIAAFLRKRGPSVVFSTYQSSPQIAEAFTKGRVPRFDLAIADESHRCAGAVSSDFGTILDSDAIRADKRLFMTATPRYLTGRVKKAALEQDYEVASMDDEEVFGPVLHQLSFGEAIKKDLLSDYQVLIIGVDEPTYERYAKEGEFVTREGKKITDARTLASQIGLAKAMRDYDLRRVITFHSRIAKARAFSSDFPDVVDWMPKRDRPQGELSCDFVSGEMSSGIRDVRLDRLRHLDDDERGLLSNARCLSEGVDVPTLDGVAFIDPRRSQVDIVQAVGRAIRKAENKTVGTIVLPVFVGDTDDPEEALDDSVFEPVWGVLKALRAHDAELAEQLDGLRRGLGRRKVAFKLPARLKIDLPASVGGEFAAAIETRLVQESTESWEFWFGVLENFVTQEGHALVPIRRRQNGQRLGSWVNKQRTRSSEGRLDELRAGRLEAVPGWTWHPFRDQWNEGFDYLLLYVARERHARVPFTHLEGGYRLGQWVKVQRKEHSRGRLDEALTARLEELPGWEWSPHDESWDRHFDALRTFIGREGHADVPQKHVEERLRLGSWVSWQRHQDRQGSLSAERTKRLDSIDGWVWGALDARWDAAFEQLGRFVAREGHAIVPRGFVVAGRKLGGWVWEQRTAQRLGRMTAERQSRLEALPGWSWDRFSEGWERGYASLESFAARHGHARVPQQHLEQGFRLGQWVRVQRSTWKSGRLDEDRRSRLEAMPGWVWNPRDADWEESYQRLLEYVEASGDAFVPANYRTEDDYGLGIWVTNQRARYRSGRLSAEQIARLERLPKWAWDGRPAKP